jgi:hypothetical protein
MRNQATLIPQHFRRGGPWPPPARLGRLTPRPEPDEILEASRSGFLEGLAPFYAVFASLRNCPGVTPTTRLK